MMGVCGLDCSTCEIRLAPTDPAAAEVIVSWFRERGWLGEGEGISEVIEREMTCKGCQEDRSMHWSPDCPLLVCCVDEKHLDHCAQCDEFACAKVEAFASHGQIHRREAVERLQRLARSQ
jgi:hypothetical protein